MRNATHNAGGSSRRVGVVVATLFTLLGSALHAQGQVTYTLSGADQVSSCDRISLTNVFLNAGATLDGLIITQRLPHAGFAYVTNRTRIVLPDGTVRTNGAAEPDFSSGTNLVWDFSSITSSSALNTILISEVFYDPTNAAEDAHEWVELFNPLAAPVAVTNWSIQDVLPGQVDTLPDFTIQPGEFVVVAASTSSFFQAFPGYTGQVVQVADGTLGSGLNNFADGVFLRNHAGVAQDAMSYGGSTAAFSPAVPLVAQGQSAIRSPVNQDNNNRNDWVAGPPDPGTGTLQFGLASGGQITIVYDLEIACGSAAGQVTAASGFRQPAGGAPQSALAAIFITVNPGDLTITKSPNTQSAGVGDTVVWTVTVKNEGFGDARNVTITDPVGGGFAFTSFSISPTDAPPYGSSVTWDSTVIPALTNLAPQQQVTLVVTAEMVACTGLFNTAHARWGCRDMLAVSNAICEDTLLNGETAGAAIQLIDRYPFLTASLSPVSPVPVSYCTGAVLTLYVTNSASGPTAGQSRNTRFVPTLPPGYTLTGPNIDINGFVVVGDLSPGAATNVAITLQPGGSCPFSEAVQSLFFQGLYTDACGNPFASAFVSASTRLVDLPGASVVKVMPALVGSTVGSFPVTVLLAYSNLAGTAVTILDQYPVSTNLIPANITAGGVLDTNLNRITWAPTLSGSGVFTGRFDVLVQDTCDLAGTFAANTIVASNFVDCRGCNRAVAGSGQTYYTQIAAGTNCPTGPGGTGTCTYTSLKTAAPALAEVCAPVLLTHSFSNFVGPLLPADWSGIIFTSQLAGAAGYLSSTGSVQVLVNGVDLTAFASITATSPVLAIDLSGLSASPVPQPGLVTGSLSISWGVSSTNTGRHTDFSSLSLPPCGIQTDVIAWDVAQSDLLIALQPILLAEACGLVDGRIDLTQLPNPLVPGNGTLFPSYDVQVVLDLDQQGSGTSSYAYIAGSSAFTNFFDLAGAPVPSAEPAISSNRLTWTLGDLRSNGVGSISYRLRASCDQAPGELQAARVLFNNRCQDGAPPARRSDSSTNPVPPVLTANLSYQLKPEIVFLQDNAAVFKLDFLNSGAATAFNVQPEFIKPAGLAYVTGSIPPALQSATNVVWTLQLAGPVDGLADADGDGAFDDLPPGGTFSIFITNEVVSCLESLVRLRATHGCKGVSCQVPVDDVSEFVPLVGSLVTRTVFPAAAQLCATNTARYDVRNSGLTVDRQVQVDQFLPLGMTYVSNSARYVVGGVTNPAGHPTVAGSLLTFTETNVPPFALLQPGDEISIVYDVYVGCDAVGADNTFIARGRFTDVCGNLVSNPVSQSVMPVNEPLLNVTKEALNQDGIQTNFITGTLVADPGDRVVYRVTVQHDPSSAAPVLALALTDTLPSAVRFEGASVPPDATNFPGGLVQLVWSNSTMLSLVGGAPWSLTSGVSATILVTGTVTNCAASVANVADLRYGCDPDCLSLQDSVAHTLRSEVNVQIGGASTLTLGACGGTRVLVITNLGSTASGLIITNTAPPGYIFQSASVTGEFNASSLVLGLIGSPVGSRAVIDFTSVASSGATDLDDDSANGLAVLDLGYRDGAVVTLQLISDGTGMDCTADPTDLDFADPDPVNTGSKSSSSAVALNNPCGDGESVSGSSSDLPDLPDPDIDLQPNSVIVTNGQVVTFTATVRNIAEQGNADNLHIRLRFGTGWTNLTLVSSNIVSSGTSALLYEQQGDTNVLVTLPGVILDPLDDQVVLTFQATALQGSGTFFARAEVVGVCLEPGLLPACAFTNTLGEPPLANTMTGAVIGAVNGVYYSFDQDQTFGAGYTLAKTVRLNGEPAPGGQARPARIGEDLIYRIRAEYFGADFSNVVISESLPTNLVFGAPIDAGSSGNLTGWLWNASSGLFTLPGPITSSSVFVVDLPVILRNSFTNQGELGGQAVFTNLVDSTFLVSGVTNDPLPSLTTVTVYEANLAISKTSSTGTNRVQAGDTVIFTNLITHSGLSVTTAYDVVFSDTLPFGLTFAGVDLLTDGRDNDGDGATDEADEGTLVSGNTITVDTNNNSALAALLIGQTATIVFPALVENQVVGSTLTNVGQAAWTSLPGPGTNGHERTGADGTNGLNNYVTTDPEPVLVQALSAVVKTLVSTTQTNTLDPLLTIGERATYRLRVDLPQGVVSNLVITDIVPPGLDFVGGNTNLGLAYPGRGYEFVFQAGGPVFNTGTVVVTDNDPTRTNSLTVDGSGSNIVFTIGTVTNAADGVLTNDYFELFMEYVLLNATINTGYLPNAYSNANRATVADVFTSVTVTAPVYRVAEHVPGITKTVNSNRVDAGDLMTFTILVTNSANALANAYDLVVRDVLSNAFFDASTISILATPPGWSVSSNVSAGATELVFSSDPGTALVPGGRVTNIFRVAGAAVLRPNQRFTNTAALAASDTIYGVEPGGIADRDRTANANVIVAVSNMNFSKVLFSTGETGTVDSVSTNVQVGEVVTYRLDVRLPETTITNLVVTDDMPTGMAYVVGSARIDTSSLVGTLGALTVDAPTGAPGTPAPNGSNVTVRFAGVTEVTGDNIGTNNSFSLFLDAIVLNTNGVAGLAGAQTRLTNSATLTYAGNPSNAVPSGIVVTPVIEPRLSITKTITNTLVDAGDRVTVSLAVTNTGLATAYNLVIRDPLDPQYFEVASVSNTALPAGYLFAVETNDVVVRSDTNAVPPDGTLETGEVFVVRFDVTISSNLPPNAIFTNTARVAAWDSIFGTPTIDQQRVYGPTSAVDVLSAPNLAAVKSLFTTSETGPADSLTNSTQVGELLTYRIVVTLPEGALTNLVVNDVLPAGLAYVRGSARTDTAGFGGTLGALDAVPAGAGLAADGQDVAVTFLGRTSVDGDNNPDNNSFSLFLDVVVLDVPGNAGLPGNQTVHTNSASVTYTGNPSNAVPAGTVVTYTIEPRLRIRKDIDIASGDAGDLALVTLTVTNDGLATAYDVAVTDLVAGAFFDIASLTTVSVPPGFTYEVITNAPDALVRFSSDAASGAPTNTLEAGEVLSFVFSASLAQGVIPNAIYTNRAGVGPYDTIYDAPTSGVERATSGPQATDTVSVANLTLVKSLVRSSETGPVDTTGTNVTIGETVTYRLLVTMPEASITNLTLTDDLPAGLAFFTNVVVDTAGFGGTLPGAPAVVNAGGSGDDVTFTFNGLTVVTGDNVPGNNSFAIEFDALVLDAAGNDGLPATVDSDGLTQLTNRASVTYTGNPSNPVPSGPVVVQVVEPSLLITKTMAPPTNGVVLLSLVVTNRGLSTAFDVVVTDLVRAVWFDTATLAPVTVPDGFTYAAAGAPGDTTVTFASDPASGQPTNAIEAGESVLFQFAASLVPGVVGRITNTATVATNTTTDGPNPDERREPPAQSTAVLDLPSFTVTKTRTSPADRPADVGETVTFRLTVTNTGPVGFSVVALDDTFDTNILAFASAVPGETTVVDGLITWTNVGPLPVGRATNVVVNFTALRSTLPGDTTNTVVASLVTTNGGPLPPQTSSAPVAVAVPSYLLSKARLEPSGVATQGQAVVFLLAVTNMGEVGLSPVRLTDTFDTNILAFAGSSPAEDASDPGSLVWSNVGPLAVGGTAVVTVRFTAARSTWTNDTTNIVVSAVNTTNGTPLAPQTSSAPAQVAHPQIGLVKLAGTAPDGGVYFTPANSDVVYTYVITNRGDTYLSSLTVTDDVLGVIGTVAGPLAPGETTTLLYTSNVPSAVTNLGTVVGTPSYTNGTPIPDLPPVFATNDAIVRIFASLGNLVWLDVDRDGEQDGGSETGMPDVVVTLYGPQTNVLGVTTTDVNGVYGFTNLVPGTYFVGFATPPTYEWTLPDQVGDTADSDADLTTGYTIPTVLDSGENDPTWDAGLFQRASLGDIVWLDVDRDGEQDGGSETGMPDVVVTLYGPQTNVLGVTTTDVNGVYGFTNLVPGTYFVGFATPPTYEWTLQDTVGDTTDSDADVVTGFTIPTVLDSGEDDPTWDAGLFQRASLGNFVWLDVDRDGEQDGGSETGMPDVVVTLYGPQTNVLGVTTTDVNGVYGFTNLVPGTYFVGFATPPTYEWTLQDTVGDTTDSDADVVTGFTIPTVLDSGENDPTWDAGLFQRASLGDIVWLDVDRDGEQDGGSETGMPDVVVTLYGPQTNVLGVTTTDVNGVYGFTNLVPGTYFVGFATPPTYEWTLPDQVGDTADSDADVVTGYTAPTVLISGEDDPTWDAGLFQRASIGNYVWEDLNGNGVQESGETGVVNTVVTLYDDGDVVLAVTTTDVNGAYAFTNLLPGSYHVGFVPPDGYFLTQADLGGNDGLDSDASVLTGLTVPTVLDSGEDDLSWDAGLYRPASLGNFVWNDLDADGRQDGGETGVTSVVVSLLTNGTVIATTTTDVNGAYAFTNLPPGDYQVEVTRPAGRVFSPQDVDDDTEDSDVDTGTGRTGVITLSSGEEDPTNDAGLYEPARLGDIVWLDVDRDGEQDGGSETGMPDVVVTLYGPQTNMLGVTTTDVNGVYGFTNLVPGTYFVGFATPPTYEWTLPDQVGDTADSDADVVTGYTAPTVLISGENDPTWDAGVFQRASLGNYVWEDLDRDGEQDGGEPPLTNITVRLYSGAGSLLDSTVTDAGGLYGFTNLPPGDYFVEVVAPDDYLFTLQDQGADADDSDANPTTGRTAATTLVSGEDDPTWDAGLFRYASLGNFVWHDINGDGAQGGGSETGLPGVVVTLYDASTNPIGSTATDDSGFYAFTNLVPGTYLVGVAATGPLVFSAGDQGGDDTLDSDIDPLTGLTVPTTLVSGENDLTWDAGLHVRAALGDYVWEDVNGNGRQDAGEPPVTNVTVTLYDTNAVPLLTTATDASGAYLFTNLVPGAYYVGFTPPDGFQITRLDEGADDGDSDANPFSGLTVTTILDSAETDLTWDAGLYRPATLGDQVFEDLDYNSVQDPGEITPNVTGVVVNLYLSNGVFVASTTTDVSGVYLFTNLPPADYVVEFVAPADFVIVETRSGADSAIDSDADQVTGRTPLINLASGEDDRTWDAGIAQFGALGDHVWWDLNNDGEHNENLSFYGLNNVTVRLFRVVAGVTNFFGSQVTTNDGSGGRGYYFFPDLPFGQYFVQVDTNGVPPVLLRRTTVLNYSVQLSPDYVFFDADFGFNADPTPVELLWFTATREGGAVRLAWETASERENLGFHLYRASAVDGARERITTELRPGRGTGEGGAYDFVDPYADPSVTWFYWLEDVSWTEARKLHGPVAVRAEGAPAALLVGAFSVDARTAGVFRITYDDLVAAGLPAASLFSSDLQVWVDGQQVALLVQASGDTLRRGDSLLFYVPEGTGQPPCEIRSGTDALRMEWDYAAPREDGEVWTGVALVSGLLPFEVTPAWARYLLVGFTGDDVTVLDLADPRRPRILFGFAWLYLPGESGLYLSHAVEEPTPCLAVEAAAIRPVNDLRAPRGAVR